MFQRPHALHNGLWATIKMRARLLLDPFIMVAPYGARPDKPDRPKAPTGMDEIAPEMRSIAAAFTSLRAAPHSATQKKAFAS